MKKSREELDKAIYFVLSYNEKNKISKQEIKKDRDLFVEKLMTYNFSSGKAHGIWGRGIPLRDLPNPEIFIVTKVLSEITKHKSLELDSWFYDEEIKFHDNYKVEKFFEKDIIVLHNVDQVSDNQWFCTKSSYLEQSRIVSQGLITYNSRTQRGSKLVMFGDKFVEVPDIRTTPVMEMTRAILDNDFTPNTITWNIRKTGDEKFEYDAKNRTLTIEVDGKSRFVDIVDGAHRESAFIKVIEQNAHHEGFTFISILNYDEDEANKYINQEDHRTPINKSQKEALKITEFNLMAKSILKYKDAKSNVLYGKIAMNDAEFKAQQDKYTTVEIFSKALEYNFETFFKTANGRDIDNLQDFLVKFFNELLISLEEKYKPTQSIIHERNMFVGYMTLANILFKQDDWKEKLSAILNNFDFIDNEEWENIGIHSNKINPSLIKSISNYFKKGCVVNV
jgi:hypothetical protein